MTSTLARSLCALTDPVACLAMADHLEEDGAPAHAVAWYRSLGEAGLASPDLTGALAPVTTGALIRQQRRERRTTRGRRDTYVDRCVYGSRLSSTWACDGCIMWRKSKADERALTLKRIPDRAYAPESIPWQGIGEPVAPVALFRHRSGDVCLALSEADVQDMCGLRARYVAFVTKRWPGVTWHRSSSLDGAVCAVADGVIVAVVMLVA